MQRLFSFSSLLFLYYYYYYYATTLINAAPNLADLGAFGDDAGRAAPHHYQADNLHWNVTLSAERSIYIPVLPLNACG